MYLIVGLGNPGPKYESTRHNIGFRVLDRLAEKGGFAPFREKFKGEFVKGEVGDEDVVLLRPLTYMNLSGESIQSAMTFFKVPLDRLVVVHDEIDLPFGDMRLKVGGGLAGHNGLKSTAQHCGGPDFLRLRFGVGRHPSQDPAAWVLSDFSKEDEAELPDLVDSAAGAVKNVVDNGMAVAMNRFNRRSKK